MSPRLALHFLGIPELLLDNSPVTTDRRKAVALLAYLAVNRGKYTREFLSGLLWPDYEQKKAFSNLRRTIWEVHQAVGEDWLLADRESLRLNPDAEIDLDIARFQDLVAQSRQQNEPVQRISLLAEATRLYRNHFLTGFSLKDAHPFNEWAFVISEDLRRQLAEALTTLVEDYCAIGQADKAVPYARRLISLDPLNESAHRQLMEVYLQAGQHSAALKQYQTCEQILRKELNLDPEPETRALYKKIRKREIKLVPVEKQIETITPKHNLPSQLSTFIGREKEQDEIINLIAKHRLVTLAGVGGIGKTRLCLQVGQRLINTYPDGVWFIALDSLSDPHLVPQTVATVFDIRETSGRPIIEILMNMLREKTTLLLLDNCEHLLEPCAQLVTTLLMKCPNLKVLATSREILNMEGEAAYYLPSLSVPTDGASLEKLTNYESVQLFSDRASLALSSFILTNENTSTVIEICRRVDGIPLAIELSAARVNILQIEEILKQLQDSFTLLSRDGHTIAPRQQTLKASMDWSWGLLNQSEQIFLRRLSVFAGGWTLESAQAVYDSNVLDLTRSLVNKSLIKVDQKSGGETRYRFHEIVRQYMRERLLESGEIENIRKRHLRYFLQLSEHAEIALKGPTQVEWMSRLSDELDNTRAALEWADNTDLEAGLYLAGRLSIFWEIFNIRDAESWLGGFIQKPESITYPHAKAKALSALVWIKFWFDTPMTEVYSLAEECLDLFRNCGDKQGEIDALLLFAVFGNPPEVEKYCQQALILSRSINDKWRTAYALYLWTWGHPDRHSYLENALTLFQEVGDLKRMAECMAELGRLRMLDNNIEPAQNILSQAMFWFRKIGIKSGVSSILQEYGRIAGIKGDYEQAYTYLQEAAAIDKEHGYRLNYLWDRTHLGYLALRQGHIIEAHEILMETLRSFFYDKNEIGVTFALEGLAELFIARNQPEHAAHLIGWSDATRKKIGDPRQALEQADVDRTIDTCKAKMGKAAFSDAYKEGKKMSLDEAINFALEG